MSSSTKRVWRLHLPEGQTMTVRGPDLANAISLSGFEPKMLNYDAAVELKRAEIMDDDPANVQIMDVLSVTEGEIGHLYADRDLKYVMDSMRRQGVRCQTVADFVTNVTAHDVPGHMVRKWINWTACQFKMKAPFSGHI